MISVQNVVKKYGSITALNDISFTVNKGEILGFLGPNGAGKTTLMRILTGYFPPNDGRIMLNGVDFESNSQALKRMIGYLPECVPLYYEMTVNDLLSYAAQAKGVPAASRKDHILKIVDECGLASVRSRVIKKLSKGYKQRVGLAQALIGDPSILVLDEPTTGLDPKQIIEIRSLIKSMSGNKTVILSTHILPEVSVICDRVIIVNKGKIIAIDTPANLEKKLRSGLNITVLARGESEAIRRSIEKIDGVESIQMKNDIADMAGSGNSDLHEFAVAIKEGSDVRAEIARVVSGRFALLELKVDKLSLEDIFVELVTKED